MKGPLVEPEFGGWSGNNIAEEMAFAQYNTSVEFQASGI